MTTTKPPAVSSFPAPEPHRRAWPLGVLCGLALLVSCSEKAPRREDSELREDPIGAPAPVAKTAGLKADRNDAAAQLAGPLARAGSRYRVIVGTAYFFDKPEQSVPTGRYLRRGDSFYGEGETNGFVKTSFVQPNGASGTAWLKREALSTAPPAENGARRAHPTTVRTPPALSSPPAPTSPAEPVTAGAGASRAVVTVDRAYFYNSPALDTPRKAFCQRGDKVRLDETRGEAVHVTFTNWEKVTTAGWMQQADLQPAR